MYTRKFVYVCLSLLMVSTLVFAEKYDTIDPKLAESDDTVWYDISYLDLEGKGYDDVKSPYDRLPERAETVVPSPVWNLSHDSAGMCVRFITDAASISAKWRLRKENLSMTHFPATGVSGLDLYVKTDSGEWRWCGVGRPSEFPENTNNLIAGMTSEPREFLLYLPLYNGVEWVKIGVPRGSFIAKAPSRDKKRKPILFYGTSITQGGCASRPGMCHTAIIGRWLDYPVLNFGFSGNGKMEPEMAHLFAELDPSVYILDCLPNMNEDMIRERVVPFVRILREKRPDTPILLVEDRSYGNSHISLTTRSRNDTNRAALKESFEQLKSEGVKNLHYLEGDKLLGADREDTVDGSHPTDLGFMRQAEAFKKALTPILK